MDVHETCGDDITHKTEDCKFFDEVVGHIEDIIVGDKFQTMRDKFLAEHCHHFEATDENKLECMSVFNEYTALFDGHLQEELKSRMPAFNMQQFNEELEKNNAYATGDKGEIFELLHSFVDFAVFKEVMLDFRGQTELDIDDILMTSALACTDMAYDDAACDDDKTVQKDTQNKDTAIEDAQHCMQQMQLD